MEIRDGYKREAAIPSGWEVKQLGDLLEYEQPSKYLVNSSDYSDDNDVPVLTAGKTFILGYTHENYGIFNNLPVIIFDDFTTANKYVTFPFKAKSSAMKMLKPRDSSVNLKLVFEMMQLIKFQLSDHKRYWISEYQNLEIRIPDKKEQTAIVTILSDLDALLSMQKKLIAKNYDIKKAAMQQLLSGKKRMPGFTGEWQRTDLKKLVSTPITDGPHLTPKFYDSGVPFLSVNNLVENHIDLTDLRFISKEDDAIFAKKCKPQKGDVLIGKAASVGKVAFVEDDFDFNIWSPIALARPNENIYGKFLFYQLLSDDCIAQINLLTNSSSQGNIGMCDIEKIQITYPDVKEQKAIVETLAEMDASIAAMEKQCEKTLAIKQGIMQELLTGNIRLV
jgi:type I restriction enzyme S subunit